MDPPDFDADPDPDPMDPGFERRIPHPDPDADPDADPDNKFSQ